MKTAFVQGYGGIGQALTQLLFEQEKYDRIYVAARSAISVPVGVQWLEWDFEQPDTITAAMHRLSREPLDLQLVINSQGVLQSAGPHSHFINPLTDKIANIAPERRIESLTAANMLHLYYVNSVIPMLTIQALWPLLHHSSFVWLVNISAKVGSINDNGLGGWYSYRSSKAALNMLTKTLALELKQRKVAGGALAIHPGTVATPLSDPFTAFKNQHKPDTRLTPLESATAILKLINKRQPEDSGTFWSWDGRPLPW